MVTARKPGASFSAIVGPVPSAYRSSVLNASPCFRGVFRMRPIICCGLVMNCFGSFSVLHPLVDLLRRQLQQRDVTQHDRSTGLQVHAGQGDNLSPRRGGRRRCRLLGLQVLADTVRADKPKQDGEDSNDDCSGRYARHNRFLPQTAIMTETRGNASHFLQLYFNETVRLVFPLAVCRA